MYKYTFIIEYKLYKITHLSLWLDAFHLDCGGFADSCTSPQLTSNSKNVVHGVIVFLVAKLFCKCMSLVNGSLSSVRPQYS